MDINVFEKRGDLIGFVLLKWYDTAQLTHTKRYLILCMLQLKNDNFLLLCL